MTPNFDDPSSAHWYWGNQQGSPGTLITYFERDRAKEPRARMGAGQTHHFALAVATDDDQLAWRERIVAAGIRVSPVMDRVYFHSIYTSDPDGHIVELATLGPGFGVDEAWDSLGTALKLPPWLESHRGANRAGRPADCRAAMDRRGAGMTWTTNAPPPHGGQPIVVRGTPLERGDVGDGAHTRPRCQRGRHPAARRAGATSRDDLRCARRGRRCVVPQSLHRAYREQRAVAVVCACGDRRHRERARHERHRRRSPRARGILAGRLSRARVRGAQSATLRRADWTECGIDRSAWHDAGRHRGRSDGTPVFLGCSDVDAHIPKVRVEESIAALEAMGGDVVGVIYPGMGHTVIADELRHVQRIVTACPERRRSLSYLVHESPCIVKRPEWRPARRPAYHPGGEPMTCARVLLVATIAVGTCHPLSAQTVSSPAPVLTPSAPCLDADCSARSSSATDVSVPASGTPARRRRRTSRLRRRQPEAARRGLQAPVHGEQRAHRRHRRCGGAWPCIRATRR